jgi:prepilin-type N-terminal cleavage/methylation domain-containing protein
MLDISKYIQAFREFINKSKAAFTLAEVLIVLAIIGVVAAMTLPILMNSTKNTEVATELKKAYSTLYQVYNTLASENGDITGAMQGVTDSASFANIFIPKLNVSINCGSSSTSPKCFQDVNYNYLTLLTDEDGNPMTDSNPNSNTRGKVLTNDNISYGFEYASSSCGSHVSTNPSNPLYKTCGRVYVDINGPNKGPATIGRDFFMFYITQKGVYPAETYYNTLEECTVVGWGCTGKVLAEGTMNY